MQGIATRNKPKTSPTFKQGGKNIERRSARHSQVVLAVALSDSAKIDFRLHLFHTYNACYESVQMSSL